MVNVSILIDSRNTVIVEVQGLLLRRMVAGFFPVAAWVQSQASPYGSCSGQSGIEIGFSASVSDCPLSITLPVRHTHSFIYHRRYIFVAVDSVFNP